MPNRYRVYVVTHGYSSTVTNIHNDLGLIDTDGEKNTITIGEIMQETKFEGNLRIFRTAQPGAVFMSDEESNEDLRDNYVGSNNFPLFPRRITKNRRTNRRAMPRNIDKNGSPTGNSSSEHDLIRTLQMFGPERETEIYNERLLTDIGYSPKKPVFASTVIEINNEFGVWLKEDIINSRGKIQRTNWKKILSNRDPIFMTSDGSTPKSIKINKFITYIIGLLTTTGVKKPNLGRKKKKNSRKPKWTRINLIEDSIDIFFAICSPEIQNEKRFRLSLPSKASAAASTPRHKKKIIVRAHKNDCLLEPNKWLNLFNLSVKRIKIFHHGNTSIKQLMYMESVTEADTYLDLLSTPWAIIDTEERGEQYRSFICFLINLNKWFIMYPHLIDAIVIAMNYYIRNITTPLSDGGIAQLTERISNDNVTNIDTTTSFVHKKLDYM